MSYSYSALEGGYRSPRTTLYLDLLSLNNIQAEGDESFGFYLGAVKVTAAVRQFDIWCYRRGQVAQMKSK